LAFSLIPPPKVKHMRVKSGVIVAMLGVALSAPSLSAQSISIGLRGTGSFPTGDFSGSQTSSSNAVIAGAKSGFGYGLDAGVGLGMLGIYAGFDHIQFDCETTTCQTDGKYTLQGVTVGVKISPSIGALFTPFVKGGVTFNSLKGGYGGSSSNGFTTDQAPGFELGAGLDFGFLGLVSITPQVRYVGQNLKATVPGVVVTNTTPSTGVNYFTFDLGMSVHTPFGMH
jgi:Outer membrane protein beta-barrel domain